MEPSKYVTMTITSESGTETSLKVLSLLSRLMKKNIEEVRAALEIGTIKMAKVEASSDLKKLIGFLEKNSLKVQISSLRQENTLTQTRFPQKTSGRPSFHSKADLKTEWEHGEVIEGLYEIFGSASGGMGKVYFVFHKVWKMKLAIKTPLPAAVQSETRLLRVLREAELWVNLGLHPNIATCFYARVIGGLPRLFIEYVDGGTLEDWYEQHRLRDLSLVSDLMLQFCHGMLYAEQKGMIHRDIKPANCLISTDNILKITDFGLVKRIDEPVEPVREEDVTDLTSVTARAGESVTFFEDGVIGSPWYMAPERFKGKGLEDIRSDIYSFGVMLYEITVGDMPFQFPDGFSLPKLAKSHVFHKPVHPLKVRSDLPKSLVEIILTCLEKKPDNRYQSFQDLCGALERLNAELRPGRAPRKAPNVVGLKADSLNNQAVSLLDLGREAEARILLEDAHSAGPEHLHAVYNLHILRWSGGEISDREVINRLESLSIEVRETADYNHLMGLISLERGDPGKAVVYLRKSLQAGDFYKDYWKDYAGDPRNFVVGLKLKPIGEKTAYAGHIKKVWSVAFAAQGRAFSVGEDRSIRVWDIESGRCLKNWRTFTFSPVAACFSKDGKMAATAYGDSFKTMDLWDMESAKLIRRYQGMAIFGASFSKDSRYLAGFGRDSRIRVVDTASQKLLWQSEDIGAISSLKFLNDAGLIVAGLEDGSISVIEFPSGRLIFRVKGHSGAVTCIEPAGDGSVIVTGGADETIRFFDGGTGDELARFGGHHGKIVGINFLDEDKYFVTASADCTIKIWETTSGKCYRTIAAENERFTCLSVSNDSKSLLTGSESGSVRLWSLETGWFESTFLEPALCRPRTFREVAGLHAAFSIAVEDFNKSWRQGDQRTILDKFDRIRSIPGFSWSREAVLIRNMLQSVSTRGRLRSSSFVRSFRGHEDEVTATASSADGLLLLTGSGDGTAAIWDIISGRRVRRFKTVAPVQKVLFMPRMQGVATWSSDGILRIWKSNGELEREMEGLRLPIEFMPDGKKIVGMSQAGNPVEINPKTGEESLYAVPVPSNDFAAFSGDCKNVYSLRDGTLIQRWFLATGRISGAFRDLGLKITALKSLSSGDGVVAGTESGDLILYVRGSGLNAVTLRGHSAAVRSLASSNDDKLWVSASDDCSLRLWDIESEKCLSVLEGHISAVRSVCFFPNGSLIASGSSEGDARLWGLEWEPVPIPN